MTCELVLEHANLAVTPQYLDSLYLASPDVILESIHSVSDDVECVLVIAHNPGVENAVELFTGEYESTPTGALAYMQLPSDSWRDVRYQRNAELVEFYRPKEID